MALATKFAPAVLAIGVAMSATSAMSAEVKELGSIDLSRPIPAGTCVADSSSGKAYNKIETIKAARGQKNVIEANDVHVGNAQGQIYAGVLFTSNLKPLPDKKNILGEGYVITSNKPKGQNGTLYCVHIGLDFTQLASAITGEKVPGTVNKGEMGIAFTNAMSKANSKVAFIGVTNQRTLLGVNFNYDTKEGGYITADGAGGTILPLALVNVDYAPTLPMSIQKALGIPSDTLAMMEVSPKP